MRKRDCPYEDVVSQWAAAHDRRKGDGGPRALIVATLGVASDLLLTRVGLRRAPTAHLAKLSPQTEEVKFGRTVNFVGSKEH